MKGHKTGHGTGAQDLQGEAERDGFVQPKEAQQRQKQTL